MGEDRQFHRESFRDAFSSPIVIKSGCPAKGKCVFEEASQANLMLETIGILLYFSSLRPCYDWQFLMGYFTKFGANENHHR